MKKFLRKSLETAVVAGAMTLPLKEVMSQQQVVNLFPTTTEKLSKRQIRDGVNLVLGATSRHEDNYISNDTASSNYMGGAQVHLGKNLNLEGVLSYRTQQNGQNLPKGTRGDFNVNRSFSFGNVNEKAALGFAIKGYGAKKSADIIFESRTKVKELFNFGSKSGNMNVDFFVKWDLLDGSSNFTVKNPVRFGGRLIGNVPVTEDVTAQGGIVFYNNSVDTDLYGQARLSFFPGSNNNRRKKSKSSTELYVGGQVGTNAKKSVFFGGIYRFGQTLSR